MAHVKRTAARTVSLAAAITLAATAAAPAQLAMPTTKPATTAPATQSAEEIAVRAALTKYNAAVAAADVQTLQDFLTVSTPGQKQALSLMARLTASGRSVYDATVAAFGMPALAKDGIDKTSFPAGYPAMPLDDAAIMVNGPKATLVSRAAAEGAQPIALTKKDGTWKIDGDQLLPQMTEKQLADQSTILSAAIEAMDQTAADVKASHFRAPDEVVLLLNSRVQKAVRVAQSKMAPMEDPALAPATGPSGPAGPTTAPAAPQVP